MNYVSSMNSSIKLIERVSSSSPGMSTKSPKSQFVPWSHFCGRLTSSHLMKLLPFLRVGDTAGGWSFKAWTPGWAPAMAPHAREGAKGGDGGELVKLSSTGGDAAPLRPPLPPPQHHLVVAPPPPPPPPSLLCAVGPPPPPCCCNRQTEADAFMGDHGTRARARSTSTN